MKKRLLAVLLTCAMLFTLLPATALAAESNSGDDAGITEQGTVPTAAEILQGRISALPTAEELEAMDEDAQKAAYEEISAIYDALEDVSEAELDLAALKAAAAFFTEQVMPLADPGDDTSDTLGISFDEDTGTLTLTGGSTGDFKATDNNRPWDGAVGESTIQKIVANNVTIGEYAFKGISVENVELTNCTVNKNAFGGTSSNASGINSGAKIKNLEIISCSLNYQGFRYATIENIKVENTTLPSNVFFYTYGAKTVTVTGGELSKTSLPSEEYSAEMESITIDSAILAQNCIASTSAKVVHLKITEDLGQAYIINNTRLEELYIEGTGSEMIASYAIQNNNALQKIEIKNVETLAGYCIYYSDWSGGALKEITLENVKRLESYSIAYCYQLETITGLAGITYIGGRAIHDCGDVKWDDKDGDDVPSEDAQIGWNEIFVGHPDMEARMIDILDGEFELNPVPDAEELTVPAGWTSSKTGEDNSTKDEGNQITKAARWTNAEKTTAEVQFQFTSADKPGMDFLFLVDFSNSMTGIGNEEVDKDARFYDMQSKLLDVTGQMLNNEAYDINIAMVTFGGSISTALAGTFTSSKFDDDSAFTDDAKAMEDYIMGLEPYYENTDYVSALNKAAEVVETHDDSRKLAVIFISDGMPTRDGKYSVNPYANNWSSYYRPRIVSAADNIKKAGVEIFGVMQSVPANEVTVAEDAMKAVCTEGLVFKASDTEGFSKAVNNAIGAAWGVYTLTDTVDPAFELVKNSIEVTCGTYEVTKDDDGNTVITWTITGVPFTTDTLTYKVNLKQEKDTSYPVGVIDTNEGSAAVSKGEETVNTVKTPQLTRTPLKNALVISKTVSGGSTTKSFTFTVTLSDDISHDVIRTAADGNSTAESSIQNSGTVTLKSGESIVICNLGIGSSYSVTETQETGYKTSVQATNGTVSGSTVTGQIPESGEAAVVHYTNTYKATTPSNPGSNSGSGGGGSGGGTTKLNTDDHYSYIIGYKDGYLRPYGTITRGEVATIFFRLLTDETRDKYWSQTNNYSDCGSDLWCNNAISTLTKMKIIDGFKDGTFRPYAPITRAQFAKIAVGFFDTTREEYKGYFTDVPENAWYTEYVEAAAREGLIQGFQDGTFRPNTAITRAQACVIVNRALGRAPDEDHLLSERQMITWPDNNPGDWYYADMQEATNSHDYKWTTVSGEKVEDWTAKLEQRDWAAFEHAWSTAHSAPGGEVVK